VIRLQVLGTVELRRADGADLPAVTAQPKRLALLVYLAAAWPRGFHRRDTLVATFWPEAPEQRARGALGQALYFLRRSLGSEVIVGRGNDEVGVSAERLWCDAVAVQEALDDDRARDALDLYRGDLLPGFHLPDARGFEEWLDGERSRLRRGVLDAAGLSAAQLEASDPAAAADMLRCALRAAPEDEAVLRRLMRLLDAGGDRAGALTAFDEFTRRLAVEFDVAPAPETLSLRAAISGRVLAVPAARPDSASTAERPKVGHAAPAPVAAPDTAGTSTLPPHAASAPAVDARRRRRSAGLAAAAAACLLLLFAVAILRGPGPSEFEAGLVVHDPEDSRALCRPRSPDARAESGSPEAYAECMMGRHFLSKLSADDVAAARVHFERAVNLDPMLADAWAGLSQAFIMLTNMMVLPAGDAYSRAQAAAERALSLDASLAEAHASLAMALAMYRWDSDSAEHHFRRAVVLDSSSAPIRRMYAAHLRNLGRVTEALRHIQRARELDPLFAFVHVEEGLTLFASGQYEAALDKYQSYLLVNPDHIHVYVFIAMAQTALGHYEAALNALDRTDPAQHRPDAQAYRGVVLAYMGKRDEARRMLLKLEELARARRPVSPFHAAVIHIALGEHDRGLELLEQAAEQPTWELRLLNMMPTFDPLRSDARFHALLRRVGLS
jgi:DNA-binding SARP family transcriptional activator/Tfp pilus assembly protein PilF